MKNIILLTIVLTSAITSFAQVETLIASSNKNYTLKQVNNIGAFGEPISAKVYSQKPQFDLVKGFKRTAQQLSNDFTGTTILITSSNELLNADNKLFEQFGGIKVMEMLSPKYCYFVGKFATQKIAEEYIHNIIGSKYPDAKVVHFINGQLVDEHTDNEQTR